MIGWLKNLFASGSRPTRRATQPSRGRLVKASRDIAQDTDENKRHWAWSDALSGKGSADSGTRKTTRQRARYEWENNSYMSGIVSTLANNLVGPGPRLQCPLPDPAARLQFETAWQTWSRAIYLADKMRTMCMAKKVDGEPFALLINNMQLPTAVKLDLRLIECDQVSTPGMFQYALDPLATDGIRFDEAGNPVEYHLLKAHPGDSYFGVSPLDYDIIPARLMLHWFRQTRAGQVRGISEVAPGLPLFAFLRRFTLATVSAAETAAMFAALLESNAPADTADPAMPFSTMEIERGMLMQLPDNMKMAQLKAEHPSANYEIFVWCLLREICRCLNIPLNIALGDSSKSNFSSARLDHLVYRQAVAVEREDCEREVVEPLFEAWYAEGIRIPGYLPMGLPRLASELPHTWAWPAWAPIDEKTDADAKQVRLDSGQASLADVAADEGRDWQQIIRQRIVEEQFAAQVRAELGVPAPAPATLPMQKPGVANAA